MAGDRHAMGAFEIGERRTPGANAIEKIAGVIAILLRTIAGAVGDGGGSRQSWPIEQHRPRPTGRVTLLDAGNLVLGRNIIFRRHRESRPADTESSVGADEVEIVRRL